MSPTVRRMLVAPLLGGLFVVAMPAIGLAIPLIALVVWAIDKLEAFVGEDP